MRADTHRTARAMTLFERLDAWQRAGRPVASPSHRGAARVVVDRWRKIIAGGDSTLFEARLGWDDLDEEGVIAALSWVSENPDAASRTAPGHGWCDELGKTFRAGLSLLDGESTRRFQEWACGMEIPFVELWAPWVAEAGAAVRRHEVVGSGGVSEEGLDSLLRHLLRQISDLGADAAYSQFNQRRSGELSALDGRTGSGFYREWTGQWISDGLWTLFDEYPVLARQLHTLLKTWKESTLELLDRFECDRSVIEDLLAGSDPLGTVTEVKPGLSDRHHGGRRVAILVFEGGDRIVYKPRSLAIEAAFVEFLEWMIGEGLDPTPTIPKLVQRCGYGWMEHIEAKPFRSSEDVSRWFTAAGALLFAAHVLRGSDLHFDNVLVGEASPVLIDLETLMHPRLALDQEAGRGSTAAARVAGWMRSSFQSTGMLSFLQVGPDGTVIDIGGLCGTGGHELAEGASRWAQLGCDNLHKISHRAKAKARHNVPILDGKPVSVGDYLEELRAGFSAAYRLVVDRRREILDSDHVARWFHGARSRILLRPTEQYARVLQLSLGPAYQRDGVTVGFAIEALNRGLIQTGPRPAQWGVVAWERHDLENLDIPRVTAPVGSEILEDSEGRSVEGVIVASGRAAFEERVSGLSEHDLDRQLQLMALSLESLHEFDAHAEAEVGGDDSAFESTRGGAASLEALLDAARSIAEELTARAVEGEDQSLIWLDPVHLRPEGRRDRGVSYYLYSGSVGVALFFAAMHRVAPDPEYQRVVVGALKPIVTVLRAPDAATLLADEGIGACHGLGGIVYALVLVADLLDQPEYLEFARRMAAHITPDRIASDEVLDVEGGAAGAILGLTALHARSPDEGVLDTAMACGHRLVNRQQPGPAGGAAWSGRQGRMLAGFAHGACGGALALVRLWRTTENPAFLEAAGRALEFENTLYDPHSKNWPVQLRDADGVRRESRNMAAWCHGAPGIALARACVRDVLSQAEAMDTLNAAVDTTLAASAAGPDHLCCGTLGRVDTLLTVGTVLGREELRRAAQARAAMVIRLATNRGAFRLERGSGPPRAGFFRGLAGIGYQMLRLRQGEDLPSVLAFHGLARDGDPG